jgi:cytochrome c553
MATGSRRNIRWLLLIAVAVAVLVALLTGVSSPRAAAAAAAVQGAGEAAARGELRDAMLATPDARRGEDLYASCGACHGVDGRGVDDGSVPAIAGQHYTVVVKQLVDYRHGRRWDIQMEHASRMVQLRSGQDLADLAAWVASLPRGFGAGKGDGEHLDLGARTYFRHCESCHGPLGEGDGLRGIPRLAGQHYRYLYRQFFDAVEQRRPNLPPQHVALMAPLDRAQIVGISDYLSRTSIELTRAGD